MALTEESVSGVCALLVLTIATLPSAFFTSQVHAEPKLLMAELVNSSLNLSNEPNALLIASPTAPVAAPPPLGLRQFQKKVWFHTWAELLNTPPEDVLIISSMLFPSYSVPGINAFNLST